MRHRLVEGGVDPRRAEGGSPGPLLGFRVGAAHRGVDDHRPGQGVAVGDGRLDGYQAAQAVPHQNGGPREVGVLRHRHDLRRPLPVRVARAPAAVAVARQIEGDDVVAVGEERGHEPPPVGVGGPPVDQHQARHPFGPPVHVPNRRSIDVDGALRNGGIEGGLEPGGSLHDHRVDNGRVCPSSGRSSGRRAARPGRPGRRPLPAPPTASYGWAAVGTTVSPRRRGSLVATRPRVGR